VAVLPDHWYCPVQKRNNLDCGCWRYIAITWRLLMIFITVYSLQPATFGKRDNIHPADNQVVQQTNINQLQRLLQALCNQPVGFTRFCLTRRVVMRKNDSGGIIFQTGFNDLTWMNGDNVDRPEEQRVVGYQAMLVIQPQDGEGFAVLCGKLQTQPVPDRLTGRE